MNCRSRIQGYQNSIAHRAIIQDCDKPGLSVNDFGLSVRKCRLFLTMLDYTKIVYQLIFLDFQIDNLGFSIYCLAILVRLTTTIERNVSIRD